MLWMTAGTGGFGLLHPIDKPRTPAITFDNSGEPFNSRHAFAADSINLKTIVKHADWEPLPFVLLVRSRTVAQVSRQE